MKRINPTTGLPFKRGDVREDGLIFQTYAKTIVKKDGFFQENWLKQETLKRRNNWDKKYNDSRMSSKSNHVKLLLNASKSRAKRDNLAFDLTHAYLLSIAPDKCPVFNFELGWCQRNKIMKPHSPSLDRINPKLGYVIGNVQWISNKANTMKNDATPEQLQAFARWILS